MGAVGENKSEAFHGGTLKLNEAIAVDNRLRQRPQAAQDETRLQIIPGQVQLFGFPFIDNTAAQSGGDADFQGHVVFLAELPPCADQIRFVAGGRGIDIGIKHAVLIKKDRADAVARRQQRPGKLQGAAGLLGTVRGTGHHQAIQQAHRSKPRKSPLLNWRI